MKRLATILAFVMMALFMSPAAPAVAASSDGRCTKGDVQRLANAGPIAGLHSREGLETGPAGTWENCQFRLYDDTTTHVFSDEDYFLAGIFFFLSYDEFDRLGIDRAGAIALLEGFIPRFFWGPAGTPDADLEEIALTSTSFRDTRIAPELGGHVVYNHNYTIFEPGSLQPGDYVFRWDQHDDEGDFTVRGSVTIVDG